MKPFYTEADVSFYFTTVNPTLFNLFSDIQANHKNFFFIAFEMWCQPSQIKDLKRKCDLLKVRNFCFMANSKLEYEIIKFYFPHDQVICCSEIFWHSHTNGYPIFKVEQTDKKYDVVLNSRKSKNTWMAASLEPDYSLALIDSEHSQTNLPDIRNSYNNTSFLYWTEINSILNQSKMGLMLSTIEGSCRANLEYLMVGIPVVSARAWSGRYELLNERNSIIFDLPDNIEDSQLIVKNAVTAMTEKIHRGLIDSPQVISANVNAEMWKRRQTFIYKVKEISQRLGLHPKTDEWWNAYIMTWPGSIWDFIL